MLCSRHKPLNASVTADCLPDAHHEPPSRAAGSFTVKSFGRRQAYESRRGTNPRASGDGYGDFDFRLGEREQRSDLCCAIGGVDGPP
jgi:hypothetical protein